MIEYYLELINPSGKKKYRLQKGKVMWKPVSSDELTPADFRTINAAEVIRLLIEVEKELTFPTKKDQLFVRLKIQRASVIMDKMSA